MTRQKLREEIAWWLAVIAGGLLCLILLPLYPLCWVVDKFENELRDSEGARPTLLRWQLGNRPTPAAPAAGVCSFG